MAMISIMLVLIVNAADGVNETYNQSNGSNSYNTATSESKENLANENTDFGVVKLNLIASETPADESLTTNDPSQTVVIENKEAGKPITASFGVYLEIVG